MFWSIHICAISASARKAASLRLFDSVTFFIAVACMPTTARMPIEKMRIAISASMSMTPSSRARIGNGLRMVISPSRTGAGIGRDDARGGIAHADAAAARDHHAQAAHRPAGRHTVPLGIDYVDLRQDGGRIGVRDDVPQR